FVYVATLITKEGILLNLQATGMAGNSITGRTDTMAVERLNEHPVHMGQSYTVVI
ncbi:MAG: hypothetical protein GY774_38300, partial [Planctomycetes bacterium]|nr:hypothetical protein [Planctomycetota bacterium]